MVSNIDWDTRGQILVATGNNAAIGLQVGSNGHVLTADSTQTAGVKWAVATPVGSVFYMAASSADTATGGSVTISAVAYNAPEGYLICNGGDIPTSGTFQGVSASLLQNLRDFLKETYGVGAYGRLPNLLDRFAGYSAIPGTIGGSANAVIVEHTHKPNAFNNGQRYNYALTSEGLTSPDNTGFLVGESDVGGQGSGSSSAGPVFDSTGNVLAGSSATNANLPPYVGMLPVIKY